MLQAKQQGLHGNSLQALELTSVGKPWPGTVVLLLLLPIGLHQGSTV